MLKLAGVSRVHEAGKLLQGAARQTPLVNGSGLQVGLERWGVILTGRAEPGIFSKKNILLVPGLNHDGLEQVLGRHSTQVRYADPIVYFGLPTFPFVGHRKTLTRAASPTLEQLKDAPFRRITPQEGKPGVERKTVLVSSATEEDFADLRPRGVSIAVSRMPNLGKQQHQLGWGHATVEAILVAVRKETQSELSEDTYLDILADLEWQPKVRYLQPEEAGINRFWFVIHPLKVEFIQEAFPWTRHLPPRLVEEAATYLPPLYLSRIRGGQSPTTGQRIEGHLISLGATPRKMLKHHERFTYERLNKAARMAERKGARIMGLGAFTSVGGDAGITVAHEADIAITSGNSLTVAATLEAAKQAAIKMGVKNIAFKRKLAERLRAAPELLARTAARATRRSKSALRQ